MQLRVPSLPLYALSPNRERLAIADDGLRILQVRSMRTVHFFPEFDYVTALAWSSSTTLVVLDRDRRVAIDTTTGAVVVRSSFAPLSPWDVRGHGAILRRKKGHPFVFVRLDARDRARSASLTRLWFGAKP